MYKTLQLYTTYKPTGNIYRMIIILIIRILIIKDKLIFEIP